MLTFAILTVALKHDLKTPLNPNLSIIIDIIFILVH